MEKIKLCECGCGKPAPIATATSKAKGHVKGKPLRFINGHSGKIQPTGAKSHAWKNGMTITNEGRCLVLHRGNYRENGCGRVLRYLLVVETALGKPVPKTAVVHHVNQNAGDDRNCNLVVCEDENYHRLIHKRQRAYDACGNPNFRKCQICKQYDDPTNLYIHCSGRSPIYHKKCKSELRKKAYQEKISKRSLK